MSVKGKKSQLQISSIKMKETYPDAVSHKIKLVSESIPNLINISPLKDSPESLETWNLGESNANENGVLSSKKCFISGHKKLC